VSDAIQIKMSSSHKGQATIEAWIYHEEDGRLKKHLDLGGLPVVDGHAALPDITFLMPGEYLVLKANDEVAW